MGNMMTLIPIEEEYGFKYWLWETPDGFESARGRFEDVVSDSDFYCKDPRELDLGGEWKQIEWDEWNKRVHSEGIFGHLHTSDDSYIMRVKMEEV